MFCSQLLALEACWCEVTIYWHSVLRILADVFGNVFVCIEKVSDAEFGAGCSFYNPFLHCLEDTIYIMPIW